VGRLGSISLCEPAVKFTSAIERVEEGKIATVGTVCATERSPSMYIRMLPWSNTLLAWAGWDQFHSFGEPASRFTSAIERLGI
jgi:hypothetical protein